MYLYKKKHVDDIVWKLPFYNGHIHTIKNLCPSSPVLKYSIKGLDLI